MSDLTLTQIGQDVAALEQLIGEGFKRIAAHRAEQAEQETQGERRRQAETAAYDAKTGAQLAALFPAELLPYITIKERRGWKAEFVLQIPDADPVEFEVRTKEGDLNGGLEIAGVPYVDTAHEYDRPNHQLVRRDRHAAQTEFTLDELPQALYLAQDRYHQAQMMAMDCEEENARIAAEWKECKAQRLAKEAELTELRKNWTGELLALRAIQGGQFEEAIALSLYELAFNKGFGN